MKAAIENGDYEKGKHMHPELRKQQDTATRKKQGTTTRKNQRKQ
jgi:hypothetical protein